MDSGTVIGYQKKLSESDDRLKEANSKIEQLEVVIDTLRKEVRRLEERGWSYGKE